MYLDHARCMDRRDRENREHQRDAILIMVEFAEQKVLSNPRSG